MRTRPKLLLCHRLRRLGQLPTFVHRWRSDLSIRPPPASLYLSKARLTIGPRLSAAASLPTSLIYRFSFSGYRADHGDEPRSDRSLFLRRGKPPYPFEPGCISCVVTIFPCEGMPGKKDKPRVTYTNTRPFYVCKLRGPTRRFCRYKVVWDGQSLVSVSNDINIHPITGCCQSLSASISDIISFSCCKIKCRMSIEV